MWKATKRQQVWSRSTGQKLWSSTPMIVVNSPGNCLLHTLTCLVIFQTQHYGADWIRSAQSGVNLIWKQLSSVYGHVPATPMTFPSASAFSGSQTSASRLSLSVFSSKVCRAKLTPKWEARLHTCLSLTIFVGCWWNQNTFQFESRVGWMQTGPNAIYH